MGSRGEEILARVQQRISALEDELQNELEKHNRAAVAHIQHQIQDLPSTAVQYLSCLTRPWPCVLGADIESLRPDYVMKIHILGQIPDDYREED
jgi:hypothetical protein